MNIYMLVFIKYKIKKNFDSKQSEEIDYVINFVRESRGHEGADKIYLQNLSSAGLPINFLYFIFIKIIKKQAIKIAHKIIFQNFQLMLLSILVFVFHHVNTTILHYTLLLLLELVPF